MLNKISDHAIMRYITRIKNVQLDPTAFVQYTTDHNERIKNEIQKLFEFSTLFYEGIVGKGTNKAARFYINDDIILITNRNGNELVTLYRVNFNYGADDEGSIDRDVARRLLKKIQSLQAEKEQHQENNKIKAQTINYEIESLENQINLAETALHNLKTQLKIKKDILLDVNSNIGLLDNEIEQKCHQLINYVEYQKSLIS